MKIISLRKKDENRDTCYIEEAYLEKGKGIVGDLRGIDKKRQISLLGLDIRDKIDNKELEGLCLRRFQENITIDGLEVDKLLQDDILIIGDAKIQILSKGKKCFKECILYENGDTCLLSKSPVFASVIQSGKVKLGDKVHRFNIEFK